LEDIDLNIAIQTAISSHAEIQSARQQLSLTQLRLEQSQEYLKPNINLIGRYGLSGVNDSLGSSIQDVTSLDYENWTLGLSYQTTLGKRNENALVHRSELEQHSALLELKRAERSLEFNVHQKIRQINTSYDVYQQQFFRMELLQRQLGSFEQLYQQQQINIEQFLDIRSSCLQAQRETTKSLIDFNIAISEFRHAIGQATVWANNYATSDHKQEITPLQEIIHPPAPAPATNPDPIPDSAP
jgi:outer membrane protein TolC